MSVSQYSAAFEAFFPRKTCAAFPLLIHLAVNRLTTISQMLQNYIRKERGAKIYGY